MKHGDSKQDDPRIRRYPVVHGNVTSQKDGMGYIPCVGTGKRPFRLPPRMICGEDWP